MEIFRQTVLAVKMEAPSVMTYHFNIPEGFDWKEGSHLHLAMPDFDLASGRNPNKIRHMSIATQPFEGSIAITTRLTGDSPFKKELAKIQPGDRMQLFHISSRLHLRRSGRPIILLSNGVGLAAFRPLIMEYLKNPVGIPSLHSFTMSKPGETLYKEDLTLPSSDSLSHTWYSDKQAFHQVISQNGFQDALFYIVGSDLFIQDTIYRLRKLGVLDNDMILDKKPPVRQMFFQTMDLITATPFAFK